MQVAGVHFLELQTHLLEHVFTQVLPLQQLLTFVLLPAIAAIDSSIAVLAIKILRFIILKFNMYYSENFSLFKVNKPLFRSCSQFRRTPAVGIIIEE
jgi:hypothetical protein